MATDVPTGYSLRTASLEDAPAMAKLVNEVTVAEIGTPLTSAEEIRDDLTTPGRDEEDTVLLVAEDGALAGYVESWADAEPFTEIQQLSFVRPELWGRGFNAWLLRLGEERARDKVHHVAPGSPVFLRVSRWAANEAAGRLFSSLGYTYARTFHEMRMELDGPLAAPEIPDRIVIRTFDRERDARRVHAALTEAFADHWGPAMNAPPPFDRWVHEDIDGESSDLDAGLWFLALDGEEVVGAVCCRASTPKSVDAASVETLGVRPAWRGRGVGRALLLAAFGELQRRRIPAVELGVDSGNQTGATRLYEQVGMRAVRLAEFWEKELMPPGSVQR
jgi:mycothiol synthase